MTSIRCRYMCVTAPEITAYHSDVIMSAMASEITGVSIVCLAFFQAQTKAFVWGNPPFDDVIMRLGQLTVCSHDSPHYQRMKQQSSTFMVLCVGNTRMSSGLSVQRVSDNENVSISWRHHGMEKLGIRMTYVVISFRLVLSCAIAINMPTMVRCISAT